MASHFDLAPRLSALQAMGLELKSSYHGSPAQWLTSALDDADCHVVNAKGIKADDTICMVRLAFLERMLAAVEAGLESDAQPEIALKNRA